MEQLLGIFTAFGLSASAGLNAYIPLLVISLMAKFTNMIHLNPPYDTLTNWWIIGLLIFLSIIEFLVDKFPLINHINDFIIQTFVRPAAGAIVFAASTNVISGIHPVLALALGLLVAGSVHTVKSVAIRPAITAATGGTANIPVSIAEEATSTTVSIISILVPAVAVAMIALFFTWVIWRFFLRPKRKNNAK